MLPSSFSFVRSSNSSLGEQRGEQGEEELEEEKLEEEFQEHCKTVVT